MPHAHNHHQAAAGVSFRKMLQATAGGAPAMAGASGSLNFTIDFGGHMNYFLRDNITAVATLLTDAGPIRTQLGPGYRYVNIMWKHHSHGVLLL